MNVIDQISMDIEELEAKIAPTVPPALSACLTTAPPATQANPVDTPVADQAIAATGHGVVTVTEGVCSP